MASLSPKKQLTLAEKLATLDKVAATLNEKAGKTIMGRIGKNPDIEDRLRIKFIPTAADDVNVAVGGGFPRRKCTIIAGMPDSGKTSMVLEAIGLNMQQDPNFVAGWLESENSLEKDYICRTFGIDPERFFFMEVARNIGAEVALDQVESILGMGVLDLFCINSLKCLVPEAEMKKSIKDAVVAEQARMNARMTRKFTALVAEHETAFILITHLSTMIGSMSRDPMIISGGHAIAYWSQLTLDVRKKSVLDTDPISREEGIKVGVTVKKNHCVPDRNPYVKCEYFAIFGEGTEKILTNLDRAIEAGILTKSGSWIYWYEADGETKRYGWQGKEKYRQFMRENPAVLNELLGILRGTIGAATVEQLTEEEIAEIRSEEEAIAEAANVDADVKKGKGKKAS